jgi:transposase
MPFDSDLSDVQWGRIRPLLPPPTPNCRPRASDRQTLNAILFVLKRGCRWRDVPRELGSGVTAWRRLRRWAADGTWRLVWQTLLAELYSRGELDLDRCALDGSYAKAKGAAMPSGALAAV